MVHGLGGSATNWTDVMGLLRDRLARRRPTCPASAGHRRRRGDDYSLRGARPARHRAARAGRRRARAPAGQLARRHRVDGRRRDPAGPGAHPHAGVAGPAGVAAAATNVHLPALAVPWAGQRLARRLGRYPVEQRVRATIALCWADPSRVPPSASRRRSRRPSGEPGSDHESDAMLGSLRSLISAYLRPDRWPLWRLAAQVQAPTLLVYGIKDQLVDPRTAWRADGHSRTAGCSCCPTAAMCRRSSIPRSWPAPYAGCSPTPPERLGVRRSSYSAGALPGGRLTSTASGGGTRSVPSAPTNSRAKAADPFYAFSQNPRRSADEPDHDQQRRPVADARDHPPLRRRTG